ncbi:hypothetical protein UVI_02016860 [Ustilaginoidea virens]|nr:hypothetical protein UVI_02016860 [Ustilaginoidea virens]
MQPSAPPELTDRDDYCPLGTAGGKQQLLTPAQKPVQVACLPHSTTLVNGTTTPARGNPNAETATSYAPNPISATATVSRTVDEASPAFPCSPALTLLRSSPGDMRRKSSPVLPADDAQEPAAPASVAEGGSLARPGAPAPPERAADVASATDNSCAEQSLGANTRPSDARTCSSPVDSTSVGSEDGAEGVLVTVMLDPSAEDAKTLPSGGAHGVAQSTGDPWHRRVGGNRVAFSERSAARSRRSPKPPPPPRLELDRATTRVRDESPSALDMTEEEPVEHEGTLERPRTMLLADMEAELGVQESRWQEMRAELCRASWSTVSPSSLRALTPRDPQPAPRGGHDGGHDGVGVTERAEAAQPLVDAADPGEPRPDGAPAKTHGGGKDTSRETPADATEPSPPPPPPLRADVSAPPNTSTATESDPPPKLHLRQASSSTLQLFRAQQTLAARPLARRSSAPSPAPSSSWTEPQPPAAAAPGGQATPRRALTRPPRRNSRRVSTLLDIVENPEPLANDRHTLGLFRFPWGQESDTARMAAHTAPCQTRARTRTQALKSPQQGPPLLLRHGEPAVPGFSDDPFDEATLWEIASLLRPDGP